MQDCNNRGNWHITLKIEIIYINLEITKRHKMQSLSIKPDGLTLGCYSWLETSCQTMQTGDRIRVVLSYRFTTFNRNLEVVMSINNVTIRNSLKVCNLMNIENNADNRFEPRLARSTYSDLGDVGPIGS